MTPETRRKTPEDFLREAQAEERAARQGHLKIFLSRIPPRRLFKSAAARSR
jgi:hypothetical protein